MHPDILPVEEEHQLLAEMQRLELREDEPWEGEPFWGESRNPSEVGEEARENSTRPAWGAQHRRNADYERPTHSNSKPASFGRPFDMTPTQELEWLGGRHRMRFGHAPPYVPWDINTVHEYEANDVMEYSDRWEWGGGDGGTHKDDGWPSTPPRLPHSIPTPPTSPVGPPPPVGIKTRAPRTRQDPVT